MLKKFIFLYEMFFVDLYQTIYNYDDTKRKSRRFS